MRWTWAGGLAAGAAVLLASASGMAAGVSAGHAKAAQAEAAQAEAARTEAARTEAAQAEAARAAAEGASLRVVLIGIPGLRWSDVSATATPTLWRFARVGSVGSLVVTTVDTRTCPVDAWLTLNSGSRAIGPHAATGPCPALPAVMPEPVSAAGAAGASGTAQPARVPSMAGARGLVAFNRQFSYVPDHGWGLLARPAGTGQCSTAIGPGAAIALASSRGEVASYLPGAGAARRSDLDRCALTVVDLGALPAPPAAAGGGAREQAVRAADLAAGRIITEAPGGAIIVVAGLGDDTMPHLRAIVVSGPGFRDGLLATSSTRQPGLAPVTDLTPSVLGWLGRPVPAGLVSGSRIGSTSRPPLSAAVRALIGQDTAAQVYRTTTAWFFVCCGLAEGAAIGLITLLLRGGSADRWRRRRAAYTAAGAAFGAVPAGTFLARLVPWPQLPHPAVLLYALALAWAAVIAAAALAGPWRRDPFGPPGFVGAATMAVIGLDVMTGSRLQLGGPFGLSAVEANRYYGVGNHVVAVYGTAGVLCAAWAGAAALRRGSRGRAVAAASAMALLAVTASGWPGFGAKVGGTIAMVPAFLLLLAAIAELRITVRLAAIIAVSGILLVTAFALINYVLPATGTSDMGGFVSHVLHGGAGNILHRKASSNVSSLTQTWYTPLVPVAAAVTALMIAWPARLRMPALADVFGRARLLRPVLAAIWLVAVLGWLADDSGVVVAAIVLPFAVPLAIAMISGVAAGDGSEMREPVVRASAAPAPERSG